MVHLGGDLRSASGCDEYRPAETRWQRDDQLTSSNCLILGSCVKSLVTCRTGLFFHYSTFTLSNPSTQNMVNTIVSESESVDLALYVCGSSPVVTLLVI